MGYPKHKRYSGVAFLKTASTVRHAETTRIVNKSKQTNNTSHPQWE